VSKFHIFFSGTKTDIINIQRCKISEELNGDRFFDNIEMMYLIQKI
jgi:hypothetical protein